jgi:hypothetical protein
MGLGLHTRRLDLTKPCHDAASPANSPDAHKPLKINAVLCA